MILSCAALALFAAWEAVAHLQAWRARRAAAAEERAWRETVRRYPWRVAAAREHPVLLALGDDVLRGWWEREGRLYPVNADLLRILEAPTKGPTT